LPVRHIAVPRGEIHSLAERPVRLGGLGIATGLRREEIQGDLPEAEVHAALERGARLDLDQVFDELLSGEAGKIPSTS
jgi:hypothetical protein